MDLDHDGYFILCRSHTGIIFFPIIASVFWYSNQSNMVEFSMFRSEFVVLRTWQDMVLLKSYKLIMMGVTIDGEANLFSNSLEV